MLLAALAKKLIPARAYRGVAGLARHEGPDPFTRPGGVVPVQLLKPEGVAGEHAKEPGIELSWAQSQGVRRRHETAHTSTVRPLCQTDNDWQETA